MNTYIEHFILDSKVSECVSIFAFASLVGIPIGITSSAVGLKVCEITAERIWYNSIIKKNRKKHGKIVLLAKAKLNTVDILVAWALIDSYISHNVLDS